MRAGRVVAFELVENLRGRTESLFEELRVDERGRTVHPVEFAHRFGNRDITVGGVELLPCQLGREHGERSSTVTGSNVAELSIGAWSVCMSARRL